MKPNPKKKTKKPTGRPAFKTEPVDFKLRVEIATKLYLLAYAKKRRTSVSALVEEWAADLKRGEEISGLGSESQTGPIV